MPSVNLLEVLLVCVKGALAVQKYIANDLLKLSSVKTSAASILELAEEDQNILLQNLKGGVDVGVKGTFEFKEGDASVDLVTTADILTQAFLVRVIEECTTDQPYTLVGEEEDPDPDIADRVEDSYTKYFTNEIVIPFEKELRAHVANGTYTITEDSLDALRQRVGIFIDPIDGTNCFVQGVWEAPLMLVGITVDGIPVASVVNRVFLYPVGNVSVPATRSLSYVWNFGPSPFMVFNGERIKDWTPQDPTPQGSVLEVLQSSTVKSSLFEALDRKLQPLAPLTARGAGNKELYLVNRMLRKEEDKPYLKGADVFISSGKAIKTWDTCGPHAFLIALGGELYDENGKAVRYTLTGENLCQLPDGLIAVTTAATAEVRRRLGWSV